MLTQFVKVGNDQVVVNFDPVVIGTSVDELLEFALSALPHWFQIDARPGEFLRATSVIMGLAIDQTQYWLDRSLILNADRPGDLTLPDWLNQHAIDRGTSRRNGETDASLRDRLRNIPDAITRPTLLAAAQSIVESDGIAGTVAMVELRRDKGFFLDTTSETGIGGDITAPDSNGDQVFTPTSGFSHPPFQTQEEAIEYRVTIVAAANAANLGTFTVLGLDGDGARYNNPGGVAETTAPPTLIWGLQRHDRDGNRLDGFRDSYLSRGDRMGTLRTALIFILPFGCTAATQAAVQEMSRQRSGAGVVTLVECRANP